MKEEEENLQGERADGRNGYSSTGVDLGPQGGCNHLLVEEKGLCGVFNG